MLTTPALILAQVTPGMTSSSQLENPIGFIEAASQAVPGMDGATSAPISIVLLLTVLTLAPAILILCTSFTRFVVVLGLLQHLRPSYPRSSPHQYNLTTWILACLRSPHPQGP